jgi:tartrate dehydrogenase/decarboxylase / D-malate dehydrogenase
LRPARWALSASGRELRLGFGILQEAGRHDATHAKLAAALAGSIGIAPTSNLNPEGKFPSIVESIHGSAFDITGKGIANPVGAFWTASLMLEHLGEKAASLRLMDAIERVTADRSLHTPDLGGSASTDQVTAAVCASLSRDQSASR